MFKYIDRLRKKSELYKKTFAAISSLFVVGLMSLMWFYVIYPDIKTIGQKKANLEKDNPGAFSIFMANVSGGFGSIGESFGELRNSIDNMNNLLETSYYESPTTTESSIDQGFYYDQNLSTSTNELPSDLKLEAPLEPDLD